MNKVKNRTSFDVLINALIAFGVALSSMMISIIKYYQCSFIESLQRILISDIFTTLYFILLFLTDYMIFEIFQILYDTYQRKLNHWSWIIALMIALSVFFVPLLDLFQWNICFLSILIILRIITFMRKINS